MKSQFCPPNKHSLLSSIFFSALFVVSAIMSPQAFAYDHDYHDHHDNHYRNHRDYDRGRREQIARERFQQQQRRMDHGRDNHWHDHHHHH